LLWIGEISNYSTWDTAASSQAFGALNQVISEKVRKK